MKQPLLTIDPAKEKQRIVTFLQTIAKEQQIDRFILGLSGGIDSTLALYLLQAAFSSEKIIVARLSYFKYQSEAIDKLLAASTIPSHNINYVSIKSMVDAAKKTVSIDNKQPSDIVRLGNIMARARMTYLFDLAKKHAALVCGTENKSEMLLGYFTRYGDEASDIEPIQHLYKTQIYQLARFMGIPEAILNQAPTAGLWKGQTDEGQFGFTYTEADEVLYYYTEKHLSVPDIVQRGYPNAAKIISHMQLNAFKHHVPYLLK